MAEHSTIEWTDATWNPVTGCAIVSPGCTHCYAMRLAGTRLKHHSSRAGLTVEGKAGPVWNGQVRLNRQWLDQPLRWKRPRRIFVCAHGDLFAENVPDEWIVEVFTVMALAPQHTFQVLTKRAARMREFVSQPDLLNDIYANWYTFSGSAREVYSWPLPNVWLGVSAERQQEADARVPELLATPAAIRFVSAEPLLGPIDFGCLQDGLPSNAWLTWLDGLDWIIVGGESGDGARPMHPGWARSIRNQCVASGVPFFFKQWGEWKPVNQMTDTECDGLYIPAPAHDPERTRRCRVGTAVLHEDGRRLSHNMPNAFLANTGAMSIYEIGKKAAGRMLDGIEHNGMPAACEVSAL